MSTSDRDDTSGGDYFEADEATGSRTGERRGHLFCFFFCDVRRAVVIVNIINVILVLLGLAMLDVFNSSTDYVVNTSFAASLGWAVPQLVLSALAIHGALKFKFWSVFLVAIFYCTNAALSLLVLDYFYIALCLLFAYPHIVYVQQLRNGIMTKESYPEEEYSCCCV